MPVKRVLLRGSVGAGVILVLLQLVPHGRDHENPPVRREPAWDGPATRALAKRACFDCHSNETSWPWYASVAPMSWLVARDVKAGRRHLNFSEWDRPQKHAHEAAEEVREREMPLWFYVPLHPEARLSDLERAALVSGLTATFGGDRRPAPRGGGDDDD